MSRDHLRLVSANSAPASVTRLDTYTFGQVAGGLVILHNDKHVTAPEALVDIMRILRPALLLIDAELALRRMLPGEMGGGVMAIGEPVDAGFLAGQCGEQLRDLGDGPMPLGGA